MVSDDVQTEAEGMELAYLIPKVTLASRHPAQGFSSYNVRLCACGMSSLEIGGGVMLAPGLSFDLETFTPL